MATKVPGIPLLRVPPETQVRLAAFDPQQTDGVHTKQSASRQLRTNAKRLAELGHRLYAENQRSLLVVLQGMDTAGKDGTIRNALYGLNPQNCRVTPFRQPSAEELEHDFLWRIHRAIPPRGHIGVFNRSHYEDVLAVRVRNLAPPSQWESRYHRINLFEHLLVQDHVTIVKCFLHISKDEQRKRLQARLNDPAKRWKYRQQDLDDHTLWEEYMQAYEEVLSRCNPPEAPWYIVPSDRKWYRNLKVSEIVLETLEAMNPQFPSSAADLDDTVIG